VTGGDSPAYHGPICAGACIDAQYQPFLDALWNWNATHLTTGYYDCELQLLSLVVASGNWWSPLRTGSGGTPAPAPSPSPAPAPAPTSAPAPAPAPTANLVGNGDFASGLDGWANWGNAVVVGGAVQVGTAAGGVGQDVATKLVAGRTYRLTATARITTAAEGVFVGVKLMDGNWATLLDNAQVVNSLTATAVSITFTVPAGVAAANVYVWKNASTALGVVDNFSLVQVG